MKRKITLYIAVSLDGFIARENGSVDWLDKFNSTEDDYGYVELIDSVDTVMMGATTYKQILGFGDYPYKEKISYVLSRTLKSDKNVTVVNENLKQFFKNLDPNKSQHIWLVGGANVVNQFLRLKLIDELIIATMPVILGSGIRLFDDKNKEQDLVPCGFESFDSGVILSYYEKS